MLDFIQSILFVAVLGLLVYGILTGLERVARHLRSNPDGIKAVIEHLFLPLFAREDRTRRVTLEVVDPVEWPEEPAAKEKPSNPA